MNPLKFTRKGEAMLSANLSSLIGTLTTEGLIPFYRHEGVDMPVALAIPDNAPASYLAKPQRPLRICGVLMYVAPGYRLVPMPKEAFKRVYLSDEVLADTILAVRGTAITEGSRP